MPDCEGCCIPKDQANFGSYVKAGQQSTVGRDQAQQSARYNSNLVNLEAVAEWRGERREGVEVLRCKGSKLSRCFCLVERAALTWRCLV